MSALAKSRRTTYAVDITEKMDQLNDDEDAAMAEQWACELDQAQGNGAAAEKGGAVSTEQKSNFRNSKSMELRNLFDLYGIV